jgi:2-polyprenyl-3-methyl-5-hydroxy-6-metoxy-1,4-benzoquinol methylase
LLLNLIEHVPNPKIILKKIKNLLSSEGVCLVKTPNFDSANNFFFKDLYWGGLHCPRHFVIFNLKSFLSLCKKTKLKVIYYKFTQGLPQWHASIIGSLREKKILKKKILIHKHLSWIIIFPFAIILDFLLLKWIKKSDQVFYLLKKK